MNALFPHMRTLINKNKARLSAIGFILLLVTPVLLYAAVTQGASDLLVSLLLGFLALIMVFFALI